MTTEVPNAPRQLDEEKDLALIVGWFEEAGNCRTPQDLQKLSERLLGDFSHDFGSVCHAAVAIALAGVKLVDHSNQGNITDFQRNMIMWGFIQQISGFTEEPLRLMKYSDLLTPSTATRYRVLAKTTWEWLQAAAKASWEDIETNSAATPEERAHWLSIIDGKVPEGFEIEP